MWPSIRGVGATFFFEHLIDMFCYLLSFCYLLAEWLAVNTHVHTDQVSGHMWSRWSLLWWLLEGEPVSWFSCHSVVIRFEETLSPAQKCFLSQCIFVRKGMWSLFCNYYCTHTHTHTQTYPFIQVVFSKSVWVSLFMQFLFPSEFWREGNFCNQIVCWDRRPGNWEEFGKRERQGKRELRIKRVNSQEELGLGDFRDYSLWPLQEGVEHCLHQPMCRVTRVNTNTHPPSSTHVVWDEQVNSFEREFVPFFFLIILLNCWQLSNRKIVLKNLAYAFSIKCFKI